MSPFKLLAIAALAAAACQALAAEDPPASRWHEISAARDGTVVYVDMKSLLRTGPKKGSKVKAWVKWVNATPEDTVTNPTRKFLVAKTLEIYNCSERTTITTRAIRYSSLDESEVVETQTAPDISASYSDVAPETLGETIMEFVCTQISTTAGK